MSFKKVAVFFVTALEVSAVALQKRTACSSYTIIDTRGTGEPQGPSVGFRTMNANIFAQVPGGKEYDTVYDAGIFQYSLPGTVDIVNHINAALQSNPNECFILEGYSQGASATVNALPWITGAAFDAVKGVFLIGDPLHLSGLACNVDNYGGTTTRYVNGLEFGAQVPANWISKTLDVCIFGDGVCDTRDGSGINAQHGLYGGDPNTQSLGTKFVVNALRGSTGSVGTVKAPTATGTVGSRRSYM